MEEKGGGRRIEVADGRATSQDCWCLGGDGVEREGVGGGRGTTRRAEALQDVSVVLFYVHRPMMLSGAPASRGFARCISCPFLCSPANDAVRSAWEQRLCKMYQLAFCMFTGH